MILHPTEESLLLGEEKGRVCLGDCLPEFEDLLRHLDVALC